MLNKSFALALCAPVALGLVAASGCSITTNGADSDGGLGSETSTPTGDGSTTSPDGSTPSSGPLGFSPSNLGSLLATIDLTKLGDLDATNTDNEVGVSCNSVGGGGCVAATVKQSDGSTAQVYVAKSWKIEPVATMRVTDKTPVIIVATGTIEILGHLDASAHDQVALGGGFAPASPGPGAGGAAGPASPTTVAAGAGGGGYCGLGGAGGLATAANGTPGKTYGNATIIPLMGGSAGGGGGVFAGAGGGAIQLVAGTSIVIGAAGVVSVGGGFGAFGDSNNRTNGGGSGGALLLESPVVSVLGTLAANGGGGGGGNTTDPKAVDGMGSGTPASGGAPGTTGAGGNGSAAGTTAGGAGGAGDPVNGANVAGAGGGGAGYIRINTTSGVATLSGTLSPAASTTCLTQGKVQP